MIGMRGKTRWELIQHPIQDIEALAKELGVSITLAHLLWNRGSRSMETARRFLDLQLRQLEDPFSLRGILEAVGRIWKALDRQEAIVLYGDYDVDGITSVALFQKVLMGLGSQEVSAFLPNRFDEGYGLTRAGLNRLLANRRPKLLIVLDCGTNSCEEISFLREQKIDVIVIDHHEPSQPSDPMALVNYKLRRNAQTGDDREERSVSPLEQTEFCTAGLVFKVCHALLKRGRERGDSKAESIDLRDYLDLVALATVADIAPLTGENRVLAKYGLKQIEKTIHPGLRALAKISGMKNPATSFDCGFRLGPRLNASGRLESAMSSLQLLVSSDADEVDRLANELEVINRERQSEELRVFMEARASAEIQVQQPHIRVVVVSCRGWHEGVVGIVASRLCREFHLPCFVIALDEKGAGKGSGRSIEGFNLAKAIEATQTYLIRGGGHAMAAGISIRSEQVDLWRQVLQTHAIEVQGLDGDRLHRVVRADLRLGLSDLGMGLWEDLVKLEPFGVGNPKPLLLSENVEIAGEPKLVGAEGKHLKLWLRQDGTTIDAIAFGKGSVPLKKGERLNLIYELDLNEFQGRQKLQMNIREISFFKNSERPKLSERP
jgi:single-stranded-DNA-specific exonuclease